MLPPSLSIQICEEFLDEIDPSLKEKFETFLKDGTMNLVVIDDDTKIEDEQKVYYGKSENLPDINVGIYYNLTDPTYMIHEFFHGINFVSFFSGKNFREEIETHRILSEMISVYFEEKMVNKLIELGYDYEEIKNLHKGRFVNTLRCSKSLLDQLSILDCYQRIGKISLENYKLLKSLEDPKKPLAFEKEEDFLSVCMEKEKKLEEGYYPVKISSSVAYSLGVPLAFWCLHEENRMDKKILLLNERIKNIYNYPHLYGHILSLGIGLNEDFTEKIVGSFQRKLNDSFSKSNKNK